MLLTRRIHPGLRREELRSVGHSGVGSPPAGQPPRRLPGDKPPSLPLLADSVRGKAGGPVSVLPTHAWGLEVRKPTEALLFPFPGAGPEVCTGAEAGLGRDLRAEGGDSPWKW